VEGGNRNSILLDEYTMLQSIRSCDFPGCVLGGHLCVGKRDVIRGRRGAREVSSYLTCARRNFVCGIGWRQCGRGGRERERPQLQIMAQGGGVVEVNGRFGCTC